MAYNWKFELYKLNNTLCLPAPKPTQEELRAVQIKELYTQLQRLSQRERCIMMGKATQGKIKDSKAIVELLTKLNAEYFKQKGIVKLPYGSYFRHIHEKWLNQFVARGALKESEGTYIVKNQNVLTTMITEYQKWMRTPQQLSI